MKKRRTLIISLLLVAALCLGIGYAAVTDELTITGSASLSGAELKEEFDGDVYFLSIDKGTSGKADTSALGTGAKPDDATFEVVGLSELNEAVSVTYTIQNDYDRDVWVKVNTDNGNSNQFIKITNSLETDAIRIAAGQTGEVTVTATVIAGSNTDQTFSGYTLTLEASDEDPNA